MPCQNIHLWAETLIQADMDSKELERSMSDLFSFGAIPLFITRHGTLVIWSWYLDTLS